MAFTHNDTEPEIYCTKREVSQVPNLVLYCIWIVKLNCSGSTATTATWSGGSVCSTIDQKLGISNFTAVLHSRWLGWYRQSQWATSRIKPIANFVNPGTGNQWRPRKARPECVKIDVSKCGLLGVDPQGGGARRAGVQHSLVLPTP